MLATEVRFVRIGPLNLQRSAHVTMHTARSRGLVRADDTDRAARSLPATDRMQPPRGGYHVRLSRRQLCLLSTRQIASLAVPTKLAMVPIAVPPGICRLAVYLTVQGAGVGARTRAH